MSNCLEIFYVSDIKIMSEKELKKSFEKYKNGNLNARYNIIRANVALVISVAKNYYMNGYELEELLSIGSIGLIKAVDTYDFSEEISFLTYAKTCINNEILINIRRKNIKCSNVRRASKNKLSEISVDNFLCIMDSLSLEEIDAMSSYYGLYNYSYNQESENFNMSKLAFLKLISNVLQKIKNKITKSDSLEDFIKKINKKQ